MLITETHNYVLNAFEFDEYYGLQADQEELADIIDSPALPPGWAICAFA